MDRHARRRRTPPDRRRRPDAGFQTSADRFQHLLATAIADLPPAIREAGARVDLLVLDVPDAPDDHDQDPDPEHLLARTSTREDGRPRITLYRRPLEVRVTGRAELVALIQDVLIDQIAALEGWDPDELPPTAR